MFTYWSLKKYGTKLLPTLEKRYGKHEFYSAHQIRATVYQKDFNPRFLPLGYILFLTPCELNEVFSREFPEMDIEAYKQEIISYLANKNYEGQLQVLKQAS
ncbi:hypothetical protein DXX93_07440 [Thalassotalea euphylliae]|uniref:Uncharacterized protein n=1 Tax=Thalassotalea euphylliae TaxID=1655234 RepID=A0A3E0TPK1_9GAMM|nr:DUF6559 family protein [Thalassotalea euphylliae]REL26428.1 hypothetical protein DXX93_07440 [Thalassotalea euphylliae]